jgi:hypothetical protein
VCALTVEPKVSSHVTDQGVPWSRDLGESGSSLGVKAYIVWADAP